MKIKIIVTILSILICKLISAQESPIHLEMESRLTVTSKDDIPFWLRSNQYGNVPVAGASGSFIGTISKGYVADGERTVDWGFGFKGRVNTGSRSNFLLIEGYAKARASIFQLQVGRVRDVMGLNGDTALTSGNFSVSGNSLGVPKVEISIPHYYTLPFFDGLVAIKGNFSHGWLGRVPVSEGLFIAPDAAEIPANSSNPRTYLHQKSLYGRLGRSSWKFKMYGGFSHQVFWGNEKEIYGDRFTLSPIKTFFYVATGKTYGNIGIPTSKIGNQLGSIDIGAEYSFESLRMMLYRQNFYDVGALAKLANLRDGLNGVIIENLGYNQANSEIRWKKILFEFLYTKNQAGETWSKHTKSGDENYYNNYFYINGWSYKGVGLGTPFITKKDDARTGQASDPKDYFINNRVVAFHLGVQGAIGNWEQMVKLSYSNNFGTFATSPAGRTTGDLVVPPYFGLFDRVSQLSVFLEGNRVLGEGFNIGYMAAFDKGELLNNSFGFVLKASKRF